MFRSRKTVASAPSPEPKVDVEPFDLPVAGVFLGSLRSEIDEPDELPAAFEQLAAVAESVISAYRRHALSDADAATRLNLLRLRDADSVEWTVGPTSRRWYRKLPGGSWKAAVPPSVADDTVIATSRAAIEALAAMPSIAATPSTTQTSDQQGLREDPPVHSSDPTPAEAPEWATSSDADGGDTESLGTFGEEESTTDDGAATRDWSFEQPAAADPAVPVVGPGADAPPAGPARLSLPALPTVTISSEDDVSYGYGDEAGAPSEFTITAEPNGSTQPGPEATEGVAGAGAGTDESGATQSAGEEQDAELRSMLAALSQDTGISLTGFDN